MDERREALRFVVLKASGSRFAYVNDTLRSRTVRRYDILRSYGGTNGWERAVTHASRLNALVPDPQPDGQEGAT